MATLQWQSTAPRSNVNKSPSETVNCESAQARVFWRKFVLENRLFKKLIVDNLDLIATKTDLFCYISLAESVLGFGILHSSQCGDSKKYTFGILTVRFEKYQYPINILPTSTSAPLLKWAGDRFGATYGLSTSHPSQLLLNISPISKIADGRW